MRHQLLEVVRDKKLAAVRRGEAVSGLCETGIKQAKVAELTGLSEVSISHLKTTFDDLEKPVRKMCEDLQLSEGAYYSLATAVGLDQARVLRRAIAISTKRNNDRPKQKTGSKGRQSPRELITDKDMKEAIRDVKYRCDSESC